MVIRIDGDARTIKMSVRDLVRDSSSGTGSPRVFSTLRMGQTTHQVLQESMKNEDDSYSAEFQVSTEFSVDDWTVRITGRADAVQETPDGLLLDEYKSVSYLDAFEELPDIPQAWVQQTQLYGHILTNQGHSVRTRLVLVALGTHQTKFFDLPIVNQQEFIEGRVRDIIRNFTDRQHRYFLKRQFADTLKFPFATIRPHQDKLIEQISKTLEISGKYLYSAPTGMGKTAASLYPALRFALQKAGMKVFLATAKGTQQRIASETFQRLVAQNPGVVSPKGIVLWAKEKMCPQDELVCGDGLCPLLINYMKTDGADLVTKALQQDLILPEHITRVADEGEICPFELSLDVSLECDVIICDYNYVFHPAVALRRYFQDKRHASNYILIIDEAHNLLSRARGYYSPELRRGTILSCRVQAAKLGNDKTYIGIRRITEQLLSSLSTLKKHGKPFREEETLLVKVNEQSLIPIFSEFEELTRKHVGILIESEIIPDRQQDAILRLYGQFREFSAILEIATVLKELFELIYDVSSGVLRILCKDPSPLLANKITQFWSVIAQSATLEPFSFYRDLLGFPNDCKTASYPSPFDPSNLFVAIYPQISTRYRDRQKTLKKLGSIIEATVKVKYGNYIIYLPSFQYLSQLNRELQKRKLKKLGFQLIYQKPAMGERARRQILDKFRHESGLILVGVSGGIFAEGIDLSGDALHGVIIIGPSLPAINTEEELLKAYFEKTRGQGMGFKYAYRNPGMTRVVQAAGRVIRSETDRGIVILVGQRFANNYYSELLPKYWCEEDPRELIMNKTELVRNLEQFWK
ncbi:MAG: ATP-dependent DNA helicase [Candidatus Heimdallarchaeota archaeon]